MMLHAIGLDSGTQGTKALVVEMETGKALGRGHAPHAMVAGLRPGHSEQHPEVWIQAMERSLDLALKDAGCSPTAVASIGISGQQHGFVALDREGRPIRPAKLWNDTSTVEEAEIIVDRLGGARGCIEKLGIMPAVGFTASKILWLRRNEPENYRKLATVLLPHNYLNYYLTGRAHMEYGDASGTGLMDIRSRKWRPEALAAVDPELEAKLPALEHPQDPCGYLRREISARLGFGQVIVSSGGGDNMMGAIGTGNVTPGVCTLSLGTSGTIYSYRAEPFVDPEGEIAAFCDSTGGWLPLLCTMNVTNATELLKGLLRLSNEELQDLASRADPCAAGLMFLPFVDGERVPVLPFASGVLFGLRRENFNPAHLARSVMEGTIFNLGYGFMRMRELGLQPAEIRATGGGAKSGLWLQMVADIFETPVTALEEQEAAAYGAALQSIWAYRRSKGEHVTIAEIVRPRIRPPALSVEPDPGNFEAYRAHQARFNSLWRTLAEEFRQHRLMLQ